MIPLRVETKVAWNRWRKHAMKCTPCGNWRGALLLGGASGFEAPARCRIGVVLFDTWTLFHAMLNGVSR